MPTSDDFKTLLPRIAPLQSEFDAAESNIATIRSRLPARRIRRRWRRSPPCSRKASL